jgi:hypothetical protein
MTSRHTHDKNPQEGKLIRSPDIGSTGSVSTGQEVMLDRVMERAAGREKNETAA